MDLPELRMAGLLIGRCRAGAAVRADAAAVAVRELDACRDVLRARRGHALELDPVRSALCRLRAGHRPDAAQCARAMQALREIERDLRSTGGGDYGA